MFASELFSIGILSAIRARQTVRATIVALEQRCKAVIGSAGDIPLMRLLALMGK